MNLREDIQVKHSHTNTCVTFLWRVLVIFFMYYEDNSICYTSDTLVYFYLLLMLLIFHSMKTLQLKRTMDDAAVLKMFLQFLFKNNFCILFSILKAIYCYWKFINSIYPKVLIENSNSFTAFWTKKSQKFLSPFFWSFVVANVFVGNKFKKHRIQYFLPKHSHLNI